jgi:glycosyltransferase involved in cell wall biosynthesis
MIKVAQVLACLDRGGIETVLKEIVIAYDKENFHVDFILMKSKAGAYDEIVREAGSKLNIVPLEKSIWKFSWNLFRLFKQEKYDVIHANLYFFCGWICFIAFLARIPVRVSHSHTSRVYKNASLKRKAYLTIQRILIRLFSTRKLACSKEAGQALFGKIPFEIFPNGINFDKFLKKGNENRRESLLDLFNLPKDAVCIGHVGRFADAKNHTFLIDIFKEVSEKIPDAYLLLVGDGPLQEETRAKVERLNLRNVLFLGVRDDVDVLMKNLFDIFIFPSLYEGLPGVLLEAQAAGLKCLISDVISRETILVAGNVERCSLQEPALTWAERSCKMFSSRENLGDKEIEKIVNSSPFNIHYSVRVLEEIYTRGR